MQLDDPSRGFSLKFAGPLDMRLNPGRGESAQNLLRKITKEKLATILRENADEPRADQLAEALAGRDFATTLDLVNAARNVLRGINNEERELSVRRLFQAVRVEVNDEFGALDNLLRQIPACTNPGARIAILTFHSGEDRRVKRAFESGRQAGIYAEISNEVLRPSAQERHDNPRSSSAKLRWARRAESE
jgi:16S rRNA (cytosine1402-N4)-methyltransferase